MNIHFDFILKQTLWTNRAFCRHRPLRHVGELLEIQPDDRIGKQPGIVDGVPFRDIHDVAFEHHAPNLAGVTDEFIYRGDRFVVPETMLAADDGEPGDHAIVVEDVEAFGAGACGEAGDDADIAEAAGGDGIGGVLDGTGADEVLVGMGTVETADDGPDGAGGGGDALGEEG